MSSSAFMRGVHAPEIQALISGFTRPLTTNNTPAPTDITGIIFVYTNPVITWRLPIQELTSKLNSDFTTISGPELNINEYKFNLKLKRSRNNLYFGAWYQCNEVIQQAIHSYFQSSFNAQIANKIIESFNFIIIDEEFDDVQLILHDISDPTYSCILEHIESELRSSLLLIPFGNVNNAINNIKQNILRIISLYNPGSGNASEAISFIFRIRVYCHETGMEFKKLYQFDTHQVCEKGAEMYWRNKYNNFKDHRLGFEDVIRDKEQLTFDCYVELINDTDREHDLEQDLSYEVVIGEELKDTLINMQHGDHMYLDANLEENERFGIFIGCYYGQYNVFLQQLYPNKGNKDNPMETSIKSVTLTVDDVEYGKLADIKFNEEDDIVLIGKFGTYVWVRRDDEQEHYPILKVNIRGIE